MIVRKCTIVAGLMAAALVSTQAQAGAFVGLNIGQSQVKDFGSEDEILAMGFDQASVEDTDTAFKIYGGMEFNDNFALRGGYADLGEATASGGISGMGSFNASIESNAFFVDAMVQVKPAENFKLFAKLGAAYTTVEAQFNETFTGSGISEKDREIEFVPGIGLAFEPASGFGIALEYERYLDVGKEEDGCSDCELDIDVVSVGIYGKF